jgi:predicted TIM-barrel fold metal-dependent hydrolase
MASVPMQSPRLACAELERAAQLGLKGVMIPPSVQGQTLDEPQFAPFWDVAEALQMPVLWFDTIAFNGPFLRSLIEWFGVDRFVLGSDYPIGGPAHPVAEVTSIALGPEHEAAILRDNAAALLGEN